MKKVAEVAWTEQDVSDERSAAMLCESLAKKIEARQKGPVAALAARSMRRTAERHRKRAERIERMLPINPREETYHG